MAKKKHEKIVIPKKAPRNPLTIIARSRKAGPIAKPGKPRGGSKNWKKTISDEE